MRKLIALITGFVLFTGCAMRSIPLCGCDSVPGGDHPAHEEICDGFDNDGDGEIDEPNDNGEPVCPADCTPGNTECSDCIDNDGDRKIDFGVDPDCDSLADDSEGPTECISNGKECGDCIDNDGDRKIDFGVDPDCDSPTDDSEDPVGNDDKGTWGCVRLIETEGANPQLDQDMIAWLASNPRVPHLIVDDFDSDGVPNQVWLDGASIIQSSGIGTATFDHRYLTILDPDGNRVIDDTGCIELGDGDQSCNVALGWHCSSWSNGNPDDTDDDGDGVSEDDGDLDDNSAGNCPSCEEVCGDLVDNNYDGEVDEACLVDNDRDGFTEWPIGADGGDCNDLAASTIYPGATDYADQVDQDCDGSLLSDLDGDGAFSNDPSPSDRDCDDYNPLVSPDMPELANWGVDDDCDGQSDEGCTPQHFDSYSWFGVFASCEDPAPTQP